MKTKFAILLASCLALVVIGLAVILPKSIGGRHLTADSAAGQTTQSQPLEESNSAQAPASLPPAKAEAPASSKELTYHVGEDGSMPETSPTETDNEAEVMVRIDANTQKAEYSTDGGKTWTTQRPEGF